MNGYADDEMLQLSGIQHYLFCPRQWALIQLDQQWNDNALTSEGTIQHANVDNPFQRETNASPIITLRGVRLSSKSLGLSGIADAIEIHPHSNAKIDIKQLLESKNFSAIPIEYKHGRKKANNCDRCQVTAQAMILEEMLGIEIPKGSIFYWAERHREYFDITPDIRQEVKIVASEMHKIFESKTLPKATKKRFCQSCSLIDICMPAISNKNVNDYILNSLNTLSDD